MLNRQARSPSWIRGSKSRGTAMSRITIVPRLRRARMPSNRRRVMIGSGAPVVLEHDVGLDQGVVELVPGDCGCRRIPGRRLAAFSGLRLVTRMRLRLQLAQVLEGQLAHLAGADDEDRLVAEMVVDLADVIDGDAGDGDVAPADAGLGADALGDGEGLLKEGVQHDAGGPCSLGRLRRLASPARRSAPRRRSGCRGWPPRGTDAATASWFGRGIQVRANLVVGQLMELGEELGDQVGVRGDGGAGCGRRKSRRGCRC